MDNGHGNFDRGFWIGVGAIFFLLVVLLVAIKVAEQIIQAVV